MEDGKYILEPVVDIDVTRDRVQVLVDDVVVREKPAKNGKNLGVIGKGVYYCNSVRRSGDNDWAELDADKWVLLETDSVEEVVSTTVEEDASLGETPEIVQDEADTDENLVSDEVGETDESETVVGTNEAAKDDATEGDALESYLDGLKSEVDDAINAIVTAISEAPKLFRVGDIVKIKASASQYASGHKIPTDYKGIKLYVRELQERGTVALVSTQKVGSKFVGRVHARDLQFF